VFERYRNALDAVLATLQLHHRAAVHFLVNMLEAYYFAHADAVNTVAHYTVLAQTTLPTLKQFGIQRVRSRRSAGV